MPWECIRNGIEGHQSAKMVKKTVDGTVCTPFQKFWTRPCDLCCLLITSETVWTQIMRDIIHIKYPGDGWGSLIFS